MEKGEIRAVIKYQFLKGLKPLDIIDDFKKTLGDSAPANATVYNWYKEFKFGRTSTSDGPRSGRPMEVTVPENIEKIQHMVLNDRKLKLTDIAEAIGMSKERVGNILNEHLGMKKLNGIWMPRLLTPHEKECRIIDSDRCLTIYNRNPNEFLHQFISMGETWIHLLSPASISDQAKEQKVRAKRPKIQKSMAKVLLTVFWDAKGMILADYLENGNTATNQYYVTLFDRLNDEINEKRPHLKQKKLLHLQDNSPAHNTLKTLTNLDELGYELLPHSPFCPDLAPSDYWLFLNLKKWIMGQKFYIKEEVESKTNAYFGGLSSDFYKEGIEIFPERCNKCIDLQGDYVEEWK